MSFSVEMLLKLVDQASNPLKAVMERVKALEDATKQATGAAGAGQDGWRMHTQGANSAQQAVERYTKTMERLNDLQAKHSMNLQGYREIINTLNGVREPFVTATDAAVRFEAAIADLKQGGFNGTLAGIRDNVLGMSTAVGVDWRQITKGRQEFLRYGGSDYQGQLSAVEPELAKLAVTAKADMGKMYYLFLTYLRSGLDARSAIDAIRTNYAQGKAGSFELKDIAEHLPQLANDARQLGMTPAQAAIDLPGMMQLPGEDMLPGQAVTRAKQFMSDMAKPAVRKKIGEVFDIDPAALMRAATASGRNPLMAVMNAMADKVRAMDATAGSEALASVFGGIEARQMMQQWIAKRDQMQRYMPEREEVDREVRAAEEARAQTAQAARERRDAQKEATEIQLGSTQLEGDKASSERSRKVQGFAQDAMKASPNVTSWGASIVNTGAALGGGIATLASYWEQAVIAALGGAKLATMYPKQAAALGTAVHEVVGTAKQAVKTPFTAIKGLGEGINLDRTSAGMKPINWAATTGTLIGGALRGAGVYGATSGVQWGIDWAMRNGPRPRPEGYDPQVEIDKGVIGRARDVWGHITGQRYVDERNAQQLQIESGASLRARNDAVLLNETRSAGGDVSGAVQQAQQDGEAIQSALNVSAKPTIDRSDLEATLGLVNQIKGGLSEIGPLARQANAAASVAGARRSTGALHDGYETR